MPASSYQAGKPTSLWLDTTPMTSYASAPADLAVDVAIIGGGIAGLSAAHFLANVGKRVAVVDRYRILSRVTGFTTAKLTSNHGLIYRHLIDTFGEERARHYAVANQTAIHYVAEYAREHGIDCDLQCMPSYTYAVTDAERETLRDEAAAAASCGLPASYTEEIPLPFSTAGAVEFEDQYIFHPRKFLLALGDEFVSNGGRICESTRVTKIEEVDHGCRITTDQGRITATDAIIATNYPIYDPKLFFARLTVGYSYVLGVRLDTPFPTGMFYSTEASEHSLRPHWAGSDREIVLVGGETHPTGQGGDTVERYARLEAWARERLPVSSIEYHWSTHDAQSYDKVPLIGKLTSSSDHLYVATGFKGWGMSHGIVAGMLLRDEITGEPNPWSSLFNPNRLQSFFSGEALVTNAGIIGTLIKGRFASYSESVADLSPDEGRVVEVDGKKIAVYRDAQGALHAVSATCTHMGCVVNWNNAEKTWDCPCHGSRFDSEGRVVHAPAIANLEPSSESI